MARKVSPHVEETRTQSSFTSSGSNCMLLQVNLLPLKGMSSRSKSRIVSLNICISEKLPPSLFLSSGYKLKSPTRSQSSKLVVSRLINQVMKANLPEE